MPVAFLADEVLDRHLDVVERDLVGHVAHHVARLAHDRQTGRIHVDDEDATSPPRESFLGIGGRHQLQKIGALGVRDEALVAVDDIVIAVAGRRACACARDRCRRRARSGRRRRISRRAAADRGSAPSSSPAGAAGSGAATGRTRRRRDWAARSSASISSHTTASANRLQALAAEFGRRIELPKPQLARLGLQHGLDLRLEVGAFHAVHLDRDQFAIDKFADRLPQQPDVLGQFKSMPVPPRRLRFCGALLLRDCYSKIACCSRVGKRPLTDANAEGMQCSGDRSCGNSDPRGHGAIPRLCPPSLAAPVTALFAAARRSPVRADERGRLLPRQDHQCLDRGQCRRRLRFRGAAARPLHAGAYPGQSGAGAAEHGRRRRHQDGQLSLFHRAPGRHRDRHGSRIP